MAGEARLDPFDLVPTTVAADDGPPPRRWRELAAAAQRGDFEARETLAREIGPAAYAFALQLLGRPDAARDVAQDSMLRFFSNLDRFDTERPVRPWLFRIVRNRTRDLSRYRRSRPEAALDEVEGRMQAVDTRQNPGRDARRRELRERVWACMRELAEHHREILVLRDMQDLSYREIASTLQIPMGTVMSRLHSARLRLREALLRSGWRFGDGP